MQNHPKNTQLQIANSNKNDEFYTQYEDIEAELSHYADCFAGKHVYLNCDDIYKSQFFRYFVCNFNLLGLRRLTATCYSGIPVHGKTLDMFGESADTAYHAEVQFVPDAYCDTNTLFSFSENSVQYIPGGDFRSGYCRNLLQEADIVVTNPPYSLFRAYLQQLTEYNKHFLIIGGVSSLSYDITFDLLSSGAVWIGHTYPAYFLNGNTGNKSLVNSLWYTNIGLPKVSAPLPLTCTLGHEKDYPRYVNGDGIDCSNIRNIPKDYTGIIGVPCSFFLKWCPEQFEIVGNSVTCSKDFVSAHTGQLIRANGRFYIEDKNFTGDTGVYRKHDGYKRLFYRILIQRRGSLHSGNQNTTVL